MIDYYTDVVYRKGYFKAVVDIRNFLDRYEGTIKMFRLGNSKGLKMLSKALLDGRDVLRERGDAADLCIVTDKDNWRKVKSLRIEPKR
jgi:hypothetical protein